MHSTPISRLGGLGIFAGVLVALVTASNSFFVKDIFRNNTAPWGILAGAAVIVVVGVADDLLDLRWWVKLIGQSAAALVVATWGVRMTIIPFIPEPIVIQNEAVSIVLTAGLIVTTMNAFNFIDGLDGLAAGVAIIGGAAFFLTAYWVHRTAVLLDRSDLATLLTAVVVGSCVGFLPHNWFPSKIFMPRPASSRPARSARASTTGPTASPRSSRSCCRSRCCSFRCWTCAWPWCGGQRWAGRRGRRTADTCTTNSWTSDTRTAAPSC
jgi:hypothetical protein